ncbi:hypothetical protein [Flavobacterium humi]|uniref:hypothetical protein n=1 Tax=Flavobacterium humi TaxID=2562683 RepID=UPI001B8BECF7|nr:hypothetical protein [Flavobacterium humi]
MKYTITLCLLIALLFPACKDDSKIHEIEITKALKEKELAFNTINKTWNFGPRNLSPEAQSMLGNWMEWRLFISELNQKPKGTIGAFQRKVSVLVKQAEAMNTSIPQRIDKPQIKSRMMALVTKIKSLDTFINLDRIPEKKIVGIITDLNTEVYAFQDQIEEIVRRSHIQREEGEQEMLNSINGMASPSQPAQQTAPEEQKEEGILK